MSGPPLATTTESALGCAAPAARTLVAAPKMPCVLPPAMAKVWLNHATTPPKTSWSVTVTSALTAAPFAAFSASVTLRLLATKTGASSASVTKTV